MTDILTRPELTLPESEAALLRDTYGAADTILEYGSGGSTALAAEMPGKTVFSVESDKDWAQMMRRWFTANPPLAQSVDVIWSDIGPTKDWGHPADESEWRRWPRYALEVWGLPEFRQPDVVLVDGRFRVGCALATAFLSTRPVTLLFDDYANRTHYHRVRDFLGTPEITGRMGLFRVTPQPIPPARLLQVVNSFLRP